MGTTVFMVMASLRPEYNQKIKAAALLAPIALPPKMQEINSPVIRLLLLQAGLIYVSLFSFKTKTLDNISIFTNCLLKLM